jgi:predicted secreted acid phosphatase
MAGIVATAEKYLAHPRQGEHGGKTSGKKAVLFDVDDTLLNTYNYEIYSNFVYNPSTNAAFVNAAAFPAVPHMVQLEKYAESKGYTVFFLTGRPAAQHDGTVTNLTNVGYDVVDANLYLKDLTAPWLKSCAPNCPTIQYKSLTRQHIESLGYDIVGNFGDQYSDLSGGFANKTFKLPNPMYYLP